MDIVDRLLRPMVTGFTHTMDAERAEAAAEIKRLRLDNAKMLAMLNTLTVNNPKNNAG